jgi:hypothetical protein
VGIVRSTLGVPTSTSDTVTIVPFAGLAVDDQGAAMQLDERLGEREAEAGALIAAGEAAVDLAEGTARHTSRAGCRSR